MLKIFACLIATLVTFPIALQSEAQNLPIPPKHMRGVFLIGSSDSVIELGRLESGREYKLHLSLSSPAAAGSSGSLQIEVMSGSHTLLYDVLNRDTSVLDIRVVPDSRLASRVIVRGAGEMSDLYGAQLEWQAKAEPYMANVDYIPSPNQNVRPAGTFPNAVTAIVVHATVTPTTEATVDWFLTQKSQVSAHYVVGRDGRIVQMVDDTGRAWHAGVSELEGVKGVNDFSVGIEIVNLNDGKDPFTDPQYEAVAAIVRHIREQYSVPDSRIVSHETVARPKGRKNDPKAFDFARLLRLSRMP